MTCRTIHLAALLVAVSLIGCDRTRRSNATAIAIESDSQVSSSAEAAAARGSIRGKVAFAGNAPAPRPINNAACHANHPKPIVEESIVVNPNGTLKNVVVYLK